jgi:TetR/AcrR family transcriptional repressor of nem operon
MFVMTRYASSHKAQTRRRILEAAGRLIKAKGVEAASVEAVMRDAGLTVGGFYAHFPSKQALVDEAVVDALERTVERLAAAVATVEPPAARARAFIRAYLDQVDADFADACPLTLFMPDLARSSRSTQNAFAARTAALLDRVAEMFPEVPGMSRRDVALAVYTSLAGAVSLARTMPAPDAKQRIVRATEQMLALALAL